MKSGNCWYTDPDWISGICRKMRNKVFFAVFLISYLLMIFLAALTGAESGPGEFPSVSITEVLYDFGVIGEGIEAGHDFIFVNQGNAALRLEPIQLS
jgi:hypothetical protein